MLERHAIVERDRIRGHILGLAVGDAMGLPPGVPQPLLGGVGA